MMTRYDQSAGGDGGDDELSFSLSLSLSLFLSLCFCLAITVSHSHILPSHMLTHIRTQHAGIP